MKQPHINMKQHIDETMKDIRVNDTLKKDILEKMKNDTPTKPKLSLRVKKIAAVAAVAALIAAYPLTVAAQHLPEIAEWIAPFIDENLTDYVYPVGESCTDNGIQVTLESAVNDGHHAQIYFTVQDVDGKDRLGEDLDLCDTDGINIGGDSASTTSVVSYDAETQTARCCTYTTVSDNITDKSVTFHLGMLMAHTTKTGVFDTGVSLSDLLTGKPETIKAKSVMLFDNTPDDTLLLKPDVMKIPLREGLDCVYISNIGYIDGQLHIQYKWEKSFDNHGWFYLDNGEPIDYDSEDFALRREQCEGTCTYDFRTRQDEKQRGFNSFVKHQEQVFAIPQGELKNYRLLADLYLDGDITEGTWKVSYKMQSTEKLVYRVKNADAIEITPFGVYVLGYSGEGTPRVNISYTDGSSYETDYFELESVTGWFRKKRNFCGQGRYDLGEQRFDKISSVSLDGEEATRR